MPGFGTINHPIRHRPHPVWSPYGGPPVWYIFLQYCWCCCRYFKACSDSTVRSIVKPQHVILLHLLLKTHNKHPLQDALINPKNVIINVLFSDTKSLKSHMFILYLYILQTGRPPYFRELLHCSHGPFWVLF